ncbi:pyridoxamine 5'-phosphate oxidase family protein [Embleya sp. NBC_00896]|uniref:pyridoxamine 5'-phosphate oxidase family protein n=1 Tax=Embleya sp. NBC_00896 TaxID=2975961 RepID=UPI00386ECAF9|nr:pyridoxamine 5'-phosphate oxidase family protein [Embleya sp. NBC_00896]
MSDHTVTRRPLDRRETLKLMAGTSLGRVVVSEGALPAVYLVAFAFDRECVVFRAPVGSPLAKAVNDTVVAFQADDVDQAARTGWTGTVTGQSSAVRDPSTIARLDRLLPDIDNVDVEPVWFRVTADFVTGHLAQRA